MSWILDIRTELRPCYVDGEKALFHGWVQNKRVVEPSPMIGGGQGETVAYTLGIVEFSDGTVKQVFQERIKFADNIFDEYCWKNQLTNS